MNKKESLVDIFARIKKFPIQVKWYPSHTKDKQGLIINFIRIKTTWDGDTMYIPMESEALDASGNGHIGWARHNDYILIRKRQKLKLP